LLRPWAPRGIAALLRYTRDSEIDCRGRRVVERGRGVAVRLRWLGLLLAALALPLVVACSGAESKAKSPTSTSLAGQAKEQVAETCAPQSDPFQLVIPSLVRITTPADANGMYSSGTGIIIDAGWVLTNQHVIDGAPDGAVRTFYTDGHQSPGKVVAADADLDLALIQADTGQEQSVVWGDEGKLQSGAPVLAIGYALGARRPSYSTGRYVQTTVDRATGQAFMVSDIVLQHGDSGGPLLNRCGQVIGINTARIQGVEQGRTAGLSLPAFGARRWAIRNRQAQ
jgi:S1-C subfamily serine protease